MSSPLDARIRHIARDEFTGMFTTPATATADADRVAELEREIAELRDRLTQLENAAPAPAAPAPTAAETVPA